MQPSVREDRWLLFCSTFQVKKDFLVVMDAVRGYAHYTVL